MSKQQWKSTLRIIIIIIIIIILLLVIFAAMFLKPGID